MKRLLVLAAVGAAAALVPSPASADHVCVPFRGREYCVPPHPDLYAEEPFCVSSGGREVVCV